MVPAHRHLPMSAMGSAARRLLPCTARACARSLSSHATTDQSGFIADFSQSIFDRMEIVKNTVHGGQVADYIPQLAKADPESMAIAICSTDGHFYSKGDDELRFCIQSCVKPFTYLMACEELGMREVHKYVGREPSGKAFNAFTLTDEGLPHNPMINAGAIAVCNLIGQDMTAADRFEKLQNKFTAIVRDDNSISNGFHCGFDNAVYMSERDTGFNNYALAHFMRAASDGKLSPTEVEDNLKFYFQCCSLTFDVRSAAVLAGVLANGGTSPFRTACELNREDELAHSHFHPDHVSSAIQLMFSCGMYNGSGEWACTVGLPAKSGVSGLTLVVVPNVMGVAILSPPLDEMGNSTRGVALCKWMAEEYKLNIFQQLFSHQAFHLENRRSFDDTEQPHRTPQADFPLDGG